MLTELEQTEAKHTCRPKMLCCRYILLVSDCACVCSSARVAGREKSTTYTFSRAKSTDQDHYY